MKYSRLVFPVVVLAFFFVEAVCFSTADAHCDTMKGPVIQAAQKALESGDVNLVLIWVQKKDEGEIKTAFTKTLAVRKLSPGAKQLADMYFFETLVRVHRAGEGAPYTGIKLEEEDTGPAIPAADKAVETGAVDDALKLLTAAVSDGIKEHFKHVLHSKNFKEDDVDAGREFVEAYVTFIHYVERIYEAAKNPEHGHFTEESKTSDTTEAHSE